MDAEYKKLDSYFKELLAKRKTLSDELGKLEGELAALGAQKDGLEKERAKLGDRIGKSSEAEKLRAGVQELKLKMAQLQARLEEKRSERTRLGERVKEIGESHARMQTALTQMQADAKSLQQTMETAAKELEEAKKGAGVQENESAAASLEQMEKALTEAISERSGAEASLKSLSQMIESYQSEISRADGELSKLGGETPQDERMERLAETIKSLTGELEKLFDSEKKINKSLPELDSSLLGAKERMATLRGSVSPAAQNPALLTVQSLKKDGMKGIWGPVSDLISAEPEYRMAVEAAGGGRLNHIVVDSMDVAEKIIERLKATKSGRATFIPLDSIILQNRGESVPQGALGKMIDFVQYDARVDNAMRYVFEETLLVSDVAAARKIGVGRGRMVSLGGELLERSGAISGGTLRGSLMARGMLEKAESEVERIKSERDAMYGQLHEVREEMAKRRRERAEAELKVQSIQAESGGAAGRKAKAEQLRAEKARWTEQLENAKKEQAKLTGEMGGLIKRHEEAAGKLSSTKAAMESERQKRAKANSSAQEKFRSSLERHSAAQNSFHSKEREAEMLRSQIMEQSSQLSDSKKQDRIMGENIAGMEKELAEVGEQHKTMEEQLQAVSASVKKYYDQMQELQTKLEALAKVEGAQRHAAETATRQVHDIDVKKAGVETRLADIKAEWEKYREVQLLEVPKEKAEELVRESEIKLQTLGNVNQKAPEMYVQKKKEIEDVQGRVSTLESERAAVMGLMEEIETKKRSVFMDAFTRVNSHFKRLFGMIYAGEGTLVLDDPNSPLDSGLSIRVRGMHDKRDKYLESMSGG
ncbi:Chromosome partition protein Smc [uncultured archaeon]|nr:Chromosome partition protein Smc [uncultured archaeon]